MARSLVSTQRQLPDSASEQSFPMSGRLGLGKSEPRAAALGGNFGLARVWAAATGRDLNDRKIVAQLGARLRQATTPRALRLALRRLLPYVDAAQGVTDTLPVIETAQLAATEIVEALGALTLSQRQALHVSDVGLCLSSWNDAVRLAAFRVLGDAQS